MSLTNSASPVESPTREVLLSAAADLMLRRNTIDISLNEIARESGMNSALIKYYFGNKSGMLLALVRRAVGGSLEHLSEVLVMPISPEEKLRLHIRGVVSSHHRHPYLNRLLHYMLSDENDTFASALGEELIRPVVNAQKQILDEGVREGVFKEVDPTMFYFCLLGACESLFYGRPMLMHGFGIREISKDFKQSYAEYLCSMILNGILVADRRT
jgi:AcrR family transcriptional regulator